VLDASEPISEQDLRVITMVEEAGKAMVIVMNKWDLVDEDRRDQLDKEIDRHLDQVEWAQRVNVAAKTGWHRDRLAPALRTAIDSWERRVPTAKLNSFLGALIGATPPPVRGGKQPKIYYATQAASHHRNLLSSPAVGSKLHIVALSNAVCAKNSVSLARQFK
jgi:GTPase